MPEMKPGTIATWIGILTAIAGVAGAWTTTQYRLDAIEAQQDRIEAKLEVVRDANEAQGEEVRCQICAVHDIPCPGC